MNFKTHARPRWPLVMMVAVLSFGCSKYADTTAYPEESYGSGGELPPAQVVDITGAAEYASEYDFSADRAAAEDSFFDHREGADQTVARSLLAAPPARDGKGKRNEEATKQEPAVAEPGTAEPAIADDDQPDHGREIIYIAGMQISVYDLENAMTTVEALPETFGGWVHMRSQNQLVLRLPAIHLKPVMAQLAKLGVVEARTLQAQDVTAEYVDLESRIKVLRVNQTQLLDLLGKAKTVEEALHVRAALDQVTMELEVALGRMRQLSDMIAYSTLTVTLIERGPQDSIPTSNDPFRWVDTLGVEATEWR
jgi:hypothetical protein